MTLTDLQRDILVKAAEGIQEGMWCRGYAFGTVGEFGWTTHIGLFQGELTLEQAALSQRCAVGELAFQTVLFDGSSDDFDVIELVVGRALADCKCGGSIVGHNDICMEAADTFTAGQEWARIFREVADS